MYDSLLLRRLGLERTSLERLQLPSVSFQSQDPRFQVGDRVYCMRIKALRSRVQGGGYPKFEPIFEGPFVVVRNPQAKLYRLYDEKGGQYSRNLIHQYRLIPAPARTSGR